jgi:hypothetical protein
VRERHAARLDADECDLLEVGVALDDLVRNPRQRPPDRLGVEKDLSGRDPRLAQRRPVLEDGLRADSFIRLLSGLTGPS